VPEESAPALIEALQSVRLLPATLSVDHITGFPKRGRAHVVVGALGGQCDVVGLLFDQIEKACEGIGVRRDRRAYTPHVTIGRSRDGVRFSGTQSCSGRPSFIASDFELIRSRLTPAGPEYTSLAKFGAR
jgi:2'-5' RNA ligase